VLEDAVFRRTGESHPPVKAKRVTVALFRMACIHADLITLRQSARPQFSARTPGCEGGQLIRTVLHDAADGFVFTTSATNQGQRTALASSDCSTIEVTGVCLGKRGTKILKSLGGVTPQPASFPAGGETELADARRLLIGLAVLLVVVVVSVVGRSCFAAQRLVERLIREREKSERIGSRRTTCWMNGLKERTAQLKFQITARKESEVQFKAYCPSGAARPGAARHAGTNAHGHCAATRYGVENCSRRNPKRRTGISNCADFVDQSQVGCPPIVWDLRSRVLEQFDLRARVRASSNN